MIDPNLDTLIAADPEALSWLCLLAYGCGWDAASGCSLVDIKDDRIRALMRATEAAWQARRRAVEAQHLAPLPRRPPWLEALIEAHGPEPWPEETT